jgi:hypothetical protein
VALPDRISVTLDRYEYTRRLRDLGDAWCARSIERHTVAAAQVYALAFMHGPLAVIIHRKVRHVAA